MRISKKKKYFHKWNIKIFIYHCQDFIFHCQGTEMRVKHCTTKCKIHFSSSLDFVHKKEKIQIFGVNMTYFISWSTKRYISRVAKPLMKLYTCTLFHFMRWDMSYSIQIFEYSLYTLHVHSEDQIIHIIITIIIISVVACSASLLTSFLRLPSKVAVFDCTKLCFHMTWH